MADRLSPNSKLLPGQSLVSADPDGQYTFVLQTDGNLVLYRGSTVRWASNTYGKAVLEADMQSDGNFVIYDPSRKPLWASNTDGHPGAWLALQTDGNVVIYDPTNNPLWSTNTWENIVRVGVEWVQDFHSEACNAPSLSYMNSHAQGFLNAMKANGHIGVFDWGDDNAWETDFRNSSFGGGGDATNWSDDVNFCYFANHGSNSNNVVRIYFSKSHNKCDSSSDTWKLGIKNLKWLVLDICDGILDPSIPSVVNVWGGPMQGLHIIFCFIGTTWPVSADWASDFGNDVGKGMPLSNAWIAHAYNSNGKFPVAIAAGATKEEAINRRENETINWRDYPVTSTNWLAWKWRE